MIIAENRKLQKRLRQGMEQNIAESEKWLATQKGTLELIEKGVEARVQVSIRSHYEDLGGKSIEYETDGNITDAIRGAVDRFKKENGYVDAVDDIGVIAVHLLVGGQALRLDESSYRRQLKAVLEPKKDVNRKRKRRGA